jgi:hypothetical protein
MRMLIFPLRGVADKRLLAAALPQPVRELGKLAPETEVIHASTQPFEFPGHSTAYQFSLIIEAETGDLVCAYLYDAPPPAPARETN